ncbi:MAG: hypothetical protein H6686_02790 [Fibrobacteria bacterium]|nr:hypothetical protein [Fibrobacteria bacterium]
MLDSKPGAIQYNDPPDDGGNPYFLPDSSYEKLYQNVNGFDLVFIDAPGNRPLSVAYRWDARLQLVRAMDFTHFEPLLMIEYGFEQDRMGTIRTIGPTCRDLRP